MKAEFGLISVILIFTLSSCSNLFYKLPGWDETIKPVVEYTSPADGATDIDRDRNILIFFNKDMDSSTINNETLIVKKVEPEIVISGEILFYNNDTIIFKHPELFETTEQYSVYISSTIKDQENLYLENDYSFTFISGENSDTINPYVISTDPFDYIFNTDGVRIKARFNEDIDPFTIFESNFTVEEISPIAQSITGEITYEPESSSIIFMPEISLKELATYRVLIKSGTEGIKDLADNQMDEDKTWDFRHLKTYSTPCHMDWLNLDCCQ